MTLVRYKKPVPSLFEKIFNNELIDDNLSNINTTLPSANIKENKDAFEVEVAAPGFNKSDFNIELNNGILTISSEKEVNDEMKEGERVTRQEFSYQSFTRSFTLPELVEEDKITAKYKNGILSISIPKKDEAKSKAVKHIEIK